MSTFGSILSIARQAISAQQTAIQVTSHNIANAETPGYARQRAALVENVPQRFPIGLVGTGVSVHHIEQMRDSLLDASFRRDSGQASGFGMRSDLLGQLESIFNEPSDGAFAATLDAFWSSWSDLANTPTSATAREVVRQRGAQVATALNGYATRLSELSADSGLRLKDSLGQFNAYAGQVAELNRQIVAAEANGSTAGDLRDARNRALDGMAALANVDVQQRADGSVGVTLASQSVVDGTSSKTITLRGVPPAVQLGFADSAQPLPPTGGQLGAIVQVVNEDIPQARARLDELAAGLVSAVNAMHRTGWSPAADPVANPSAPVAPPGWSGSNVDFFDPAGVSASSLKLSSAVTADRGNIAAGTTYGGTGDNVLARGLARLRDDSVNIGSSSIVLGAHYRDTVTGIAMSTQAANESATVFDTLASQAEVRRQGVSGVNTDEELITLMRQQQAYVAATRLVSVVDEMADALLNMV